MSRQLKAKSGGLKKRDYYVSWLEVSQASGVVYATSPEEAIIKAKRELPIEEGYEEEYFVRPHLDSFECCGRSDDKEFEHDYVQLLLRTLQRNLGKRLSPKINNPEDISKKGGESI